MTVKVPVFNLTVSNNPTPTPYKSANVSAEAFNTTAGLDDLGRGSIYAGKAIDEIQEQQDKVQAAENANLFDSNTMNVLYDKEKGFYSKSGKSAVDSMQGTLEGLQKAKEDIIGSAQNNRQKGMTSQIIDAKIQNIQERMMQYGIQQNQEWKKQTLATTIDNQTQMAVVNKYDTKAIYSSIGNIRQGIAELSGETDPTLLKKMQDEATSKALISVIEGRVGDKALNAKEFFEAHKNDIDPTKWDDVEKIINANDSDVRSRLLADGWLSSGVSEEDAFSKAHQIGDLDLRDATEAQISSVYGKKRELERQAKQDLEDKVWTQLEKNPDINLIPSSLDHSTKESMKNFCIKGGKPETDPNVYTGLFEMKLNNAGEFAKVDLNQYRGYISNSEYKDLREAQIRFQQHGYTSITPDDDAVAQIVGTFGGWNKPKPELVASQMQNIVQEEERRLGKKYSKEELPAVEERIGKWLKYSKEGSTPFVLEQNKMKAGFYKGLSNDVSYFAKVHGRQPDQKEFQSLLYQRAARTVQSQNSNTYREAVSQTTARPHETKEVTYFADKYLPSLSKQLGIKINVVNGGRYNPRAKGYSSYHNVNGVSQAVDVSMGEHSTQDREKLFVAQLNNPLVRKIGTSDKDLLKKYGNNPKVENEKSFDAERGTNHVNHMHLTLNVNNNANAGVVAQNKSQAGRVLVMNPSGASGYIPEAQLAEALKAGYKKL